MRRLALALAVAAAASACSDEGTGLAREDEDPLPADARVDEFGSWDSLRWEVMDHTLGRGRVAAANLAPLAGTVALKLAEGTFNGAEFRSTARLGPGVVEGRIKVAGAPGSVTALFLYEGVPERNEEIDVEVLGGTRTALFTVWQEGVEVFHQSLTLPFDPAADFHDYRITWSRDRVRWHVDGAVLAQAGGLALTSDLHLYVNAWWPVWLDGGPAQAGHMAVVERLVY